MTTRTLAPRLASALCVALLLASGSRAPALGAGPANAAPSAGAASTAPGNALPKLPADPALPAPAVEIAPPTKTRSGQTPQARALELAGKIAISKHALHEARRAAADLKDGPLRAAVEAQMQAPWLSPEAFVYGHPAEAEAMLRAAGLLAADARLAIPPSGTGSFAAAPGGPCGAGHHAYPGGLAVHEYANLAHARALAAVYKDAYGLELNGEWITAAALWHDAMKASTLPWDANGDCPSKEPVLGGTALHHTLGIASAILRHLPPPLVVVIASAHAAPTAERIRDVCNWLRVGGILAVGNPDAIPCPSVDVGAPRIPIEAFVNNSADSDYAITGAAWTWYASQTPAGWERFAALAQDGSDLAAWQKASRQFGESK